MMKNFSETTKQKVISERKEDCCGCGACLAACPQGAIALEQDEYGFLWYHVDDKKCIHCGRCVSLCPIQGKQPVQKPGEVFGAWSKDGDLRRSSASGGVFAAVAKNALERGWTVWGAASKKDFPGTVVHMKIEDQKDLSRLQGSKYVQSDTRDVFCQIRGELTEGKQVLFSGTPCQVAAVKQYAGKYGENLYTIDLICHGVPNGEMFSDYLKALENIYGGKVSRFTFRDKTLGWGLNGSAVFNFPGGKIKKIIIPDKNSSYFTLFLQSKIYRESCYQCPYAQMERAGDLTIGDYWGVEEEHPEWLKAKNFCEAEGISCILVNTKKGKELLAQSQERLNLLPSKPQKVAAHNGQLRGPSKKPGDYDQVMEYVRTEGFERLERNLKRSLGHKYWLNLLKAKMPQKVKKFIKSFQMGKSSKRV